MIYNSLGYHTAISQILIEVMENKCPYCACISLKSQSLNSPIKQQSCTEKMGEKFAIKENSDHKSGWKAIGNHK